MSARAIRTQPGRQRRPRVPFAYVVIEYEGRVTAGLRGCGDERRAAPVRAWLASDPELAEFCRLALRLQERMAAA